MQNLQHRNQQRARLQIPPPPNKQLQQRLLPHLPPKTVLEGNQFSDVDCEFVQQFVEEECFVHAF